MIKEVSLDEITVSNPYLRKDTDTSSLQKSLETIGLIHPLTVNEKLELLAGSRRYEAIKELGWEKVPVQVVSHNSLKEELISIDENLVRKPLDKLELEKCLNRGREIYEELHPEAERVELEIKTLTPAEKKEEKEAIENDSTSFAAVTAEKTGLSKSVIRSAIKRDALSSEKIKEARSEGKLSASQVNEIIRLKPSEQDEIVEYIKDKPVKDVRKIVAIASDAGVEAGIEASLETQSLPREFSQLHVMSKKTHKILSQILLEDIPFDGIELKKILKDTQSLRDSLDDFLYRYDPSQEKAESHQYEQENQLH